MTKKITLIVLTLLFFIIPEYASSWEDDSTHYELSLKAVDFSVLSPTNGVFGFTHEFDKSGRCGFKGGWG